HYAKKNQPAPYKTLGSFRKARRSDTLSPAFKKWRYCRKDEKQYEGWKKILGEENMPEDLDKFGDLKYNKNKQQEFKNLKQIREQEIVYAIALKGGKHSGKLKIFKHISLTD
ncbi:MAG: hypothetical protein IJ373_06540, partial [Clostridia bacterium]|nr:hypothetical protein [Clostridia bacterium]